MTFPDFGPHANRPEIADFTAISESAFRLFHARTRPPASEVLLPIRELFNRTVVVGESTSYSIRLLSSWGMALQALALGRVRLEQTIVFAYLAREDRDLGLRPFVEFVSIEEYKHATTALTHEVFRKYLSPQPDLEQLRAAAVKAQAAREANDGTNDEHFARKWTKLDLRSMARKVDEWSKATKSPFRNVGLEAFYLSYYRSGSSVVHADVAPLSYRYLVPVEIPGKGFTVVPDPAWALITSAVVAACDLVHLYEVMRFFGEEPSAEFLELRNSWRRAQDRHIP